MGTVRQRLVELLAEGRWTAIELSQELAVQEREVFEHLRHVKRSLTGRRLKVVPYACLSCGYVFTKRDRLDRPGRCPVCRQSHIRVAEFFIE